MSLFTRRTAWVGAVVLAPALVVLGAAFGWPLTKIFGSPDFSALWSWSLKSWVVTDIDARGEAIKTVYEPLAAARNLSIIFLGVVVALASASRIIEIFSRTDPGRDAESASPLTLARQRLDGELGAIETLIQSYLQKNKSYSSALTRGSRGLISSGSPENICAAIKLLIAENQIMLQATEEYERSLQESKSQITALRSALVQTQELNMRDPLTQVATRGRFDSMLTKSVSEANRNQTLLCLILTDIDNFKNINDTYGHPIGDEVLKNFADIMTKNVKSNDTVARYGGEEFAIILPQTTVEEATRMAERIRKQTEAGSWVVKGGPQVCRFTSSFGVAKLQPGESPENLIQRADTKLYMSKSKGKNRVTAEDSDNNMLT